MTQPLEPNGQAQSTLNVMAAWPEGHSAFLKSDSICEASGVSIQRIELVRFWVSVINGCEYCCAMHRDKARQTGLPEDVLNRIVDDRKLDRLDKADQSALRLAEVLTRMVDHDCREAIDEASKHLAKRELAVLVHVVATINAWNRLVKASGMTAQDYEGKPA